MKYMKLFFIAIVTILLFSCWKKGVPLFVGQSTNQNFEVAILFDFDGVRVYRFQDNGHARYFARTISGPVMEWVEQEQVGKTTIIHPMQVPTLEE